MEKPTSATEQDELKKKVYVCLPISDGRVRDALSSAARGLAPKDPAKYHLTLKFIHEIEADNLQKLLGALPSLAARHEPFELSLAAAGAFPDSDVVWRGVEPSTPLADLQAEVDRLVLSLGCPTADYATFNPHISIGRGRLPASARALPAVWLADSLQVRAPGNNGASAPPLLELGLGTPAAD